MSRVTFINTPDLVEQEQIRTAHRVRLVAETEEGTGVNALPGGVYGFTYSPGLPNAPLFGTRRYRSYETHKLADGGVFIIAYADADTARQLSSAQADLSIQVHAEPNQDVPTLVKIPYSRIRHHRQYSAPNQGGFAVTLGQVEK